MDRLEFPLEFLESMRGNFLGPADWQTKSLPLLDGLAAAIRARSTQDIRSWVERIDFDPELLGSAFLIVYRFAVDYLNQCLSQDHSHTQ